MTKGNEDKPVQVAGVLNLILLLVPAVLITWTWHNVFTGDNMFFQGVFMIALFGISVYYTTLIVWGIRLFTGDSRKIGLGQPIALFLSNVLPMIFIYRYMV